MIGTALRPCAWILKCTMNCRAHDTVLRGMVSSGSGFKEITHVWGERETSDDWHSTEEIMCMDT